MALKSIYVNDNIKDKVNPFIPVLLERDGINSYSKAISYLILKGLQAEFDLDVDVKTMLLDGRVLRWSSPGGSHISG